MTLSAVPDEASAEASGVLNATGMLGYALGTAVVGSFLLERFYRSVVDNVFAAQGVAITAERRDSLAHSLQDAAETGTSGNAGGVSQLAHAGRAGPAPCGVRGSNLPGQRSTLLLLVVFSLVVLVSSTLLPGGSSTTGERSVETSCDRDAPEATDDD